MPLIEARDVTEAVLWLVSPRTRYITGAVVARRRRPRRDVIKTRRGFIAPAEERDLARTDGDSWDLLNSVGATATAVAAQRAVATNRTDPLISDPLAEPLLDALGADYHLQFARGELAGDAGDLGELRAMVDSIALRTRYFDDFLLEAMDAGVRQAVILASGLDTRAYRLPWVAAATVFEIDQPEVIEFKTTTLEAGRRAAGATSTATGSRPPQRLARGPACCGLRPPRAHRVDRRGPAHLPAARSGGQAVRRRRRAQRAGQPDRDGGRRRDHRRTAGADQRPDEVDAGRNSGDAPVDVADLWYVGERRQASDYLAAKGWATTTAARPRCSGSTAWHCPKAGSPRSVTRST